MTSVAAIRKPRTKRVPQYALDHFALELRKVIEEKFEGNQTRAAKALDCSQPHLSNILSGKVGPGLNQLMAMRQLTGRSIDALLGLPPTPGDELVHRLLETVQENAMARLIVTEQATKAAEQKALEARAIERASRRKTKSDEEK